jgi:cytoskeleton protein RodZ
LEDLSRILRIQQFYLQSLEAEDRSNLPARPYVSGYVRSYALRVRLDPREANQRLQHIWPLEEDAASTVKALRFPNAPRERRFRGRGLTLAGLAVLVGAYAFWYFEAFRQQEPATMSPVAELETDPAAPDGQTASFPPVTPELGRVLGPLAPVNLQQLAPEQLQRLAHGGNADAEPQFKALPDGPFPRPRPGTPPAVIWAKQYGEPSQAVDDLVEGEQASIGVAPAPGGMGTTGARTGTAVNGSQLSAYLPKLQLRADLGPLNADIPAVATLARGQVPDGDAVTPEPVYHGRTQAFAAVPPNADPDGKKALVKNRVVLSAEGAASWIEIRDNSGSVVFSRLLKAGQSMQVPNRRGLQLTTGNAGALVVWVDGVRLPAMGRNGAVVRGVSLDPDELMDGQG